MKNSAFILLLLIGVFFSCTNSKSIVSNSEKPTTIQNDTIRIANDELEYEVIIIDPGFSTWLSSRSYPRGYHTQSYLENKNRVWVSEWNRRVLQPQLYNSSLYEMTINYDSFVDYGYEVNYLIYNYMIYFQNTFKQKLFGYVPIR
ncbi:DUF6146 family protein [Flavobacterium sp. K5-23]|uniref:DUF6146 family protein n=1 Tax=Flavobacterium sp. K5-23 TaxID=2746225 RepID=UPI00200D1255|nr:DUF6146 family protein [Flavobacterium sp. K5-23]UQD56440.1 hypothetical protein FLAK523_08620 [Flavobacterium sp. K5-23]